MHLYHVNKSLNVRSCEVCIFIQHDSVFSVSPCELIALISRFQRMLRFMHLPAVIFMSYSLCAVWKMSVTMTLFEQFDLLLILFIISNAHKLS